MFIEIYTISVCRKYDHKEFLDSLHLILTDQSMIKERENGNERKRYKNKFRVSPPHRGNNLKPQDSFGKNYKTLSWSSESEAHFRKTLINLPAIVLNNIFLCYNVIWQNITMYITYGRVFGGTPNILIFWVISWKWNKFGANNEQGIHSSYRSIKSGINKRKLSHLIFLSYTKTYLVALITKTKIKNLKKWRWIGVKQNINLKYIIKIRKASSRATIHIFHVCTVLK